MNVEILDRAKGDLLDGARFYERQSAGVGEYFLNSLFADIDSLQFYGGIHSVHYGYHRLLSKRFPFAVYYRVEDGVVKVYAVLDCRQNPASIRDRLTSG